MVARTNSTALRKGLARELRRRRRSHGITQEQLAFESGLHRNYIGLLERGLKSPTIDVLQQLARALGTKPSELLASAEAFGWGRKPHE